MSTLLQKADSLDRRVLGETRMTTPEGWTRNMSWWWLPLASGVVFLALIVFWAASFTPWWGRAVMVLALGANLLMSGYRAGLMKAEHDRLQGCDTVLGKRRPAGL